MERVEQNSIDPVEMQLRRNKDYIASLKMLGEGAPVHEMPEAHLAEHEGFDEKDLPHTYQ